MTGGDDEKKLYDFCIPVLIIKREMARKNIAINPSEERWGNYY
jgi:hypothetical protein